jgi:hypothetical protein
MTTSPLVDETPGSATRTWGGGDPLTRLLLVLSLATIAYLLVHISMFRYGRDQGVYATVADAILRGGMPYRDAWDVKTPGIFAVYALVRATLGPAQSSIRIVEVLGLASMVGAFVVLSRRLFGDWRVGLFGGALAVLVHAQLEFWHTAQPESFAGMLTAWALVLATSEPAPPARHALARQLAAWGLAGLLYGVCFLLKPPLGGGVAVSSAFAARRAWRATAPGARTSRRRAAATPVLVMAAGAALPVAGCLVLFWARGALRDLYDTLFVFVPGYTKLGWEGMDLPGLLYFAIEQWAVAFSSANALGMLLALLLPARAPREREGTLHVLLVVAVQLVGVAMQAKFYHYHYGASFLLGSLVAGLGAYKLWQRARVNAVPALLYLTLLPTVIAARSATRDTATGFLDRCIARQRFLFGLSGETRAELDARLYYVAGVSYEANRRVADRLRERLAPEELAYVWGFEPVIYDLSQRRPASRYIYDVPQRAPWFKQRARAELIGDLDAHPPRAIVVEHQDVVYAMTGDVVDSADTLREFPALATRLARSYELESTIGNLDVYFRRD